MNSNNISRFRNTFAGTCLLLLCAATTTALASDDSVQIKQVPYKDAAGNSVLLSLYGGDGVEFSRNILCKKDDGCTLFGYTNKSFGDSTDFLAIHLGTKSEPSWAETYGGTNLDALYNATPTSDGGYFTSGASASMFFTFMKFMSPRRDTRPIYMKLDKSGKLQWSGNIELASNISTAEIAKAVQTPDGGYILIGTYTEAYPKSGDQPMPDEWSAPAPGRTKGWQYSYPLLLKLAADGKPEWMQRYLFGDVGGSATSAVLMPSGHVLVAGTVYDQPDQPLFIMELDTKGMPVHAEEYTIAGEQGTNAFIQLSDGSYMLTGHSIQGNATHSVFVAHFATDGKFDFGSLFKLPAGVRSLGMVQGQDGRICVVGRTEDGSTNKAEGMALLVDEHSNDIGEFWLSGSGNTELEDAAQTTAGGYEIIGDTGAFGADNFDIVRFTWVPGAKMQKRLAQEPYQPKVVSVTVTTQTGKLDRVRGIPVSLIAVKNPTVPSGSSSN